MYKYINTNTYIYIYLDKYIYIYIYTHMCVYVRICIYGCTFHWDHSTHPRSPVIASPGDLFQNSHLPGRWPRCEMVHGILMGWLIVINGDWWWVMMMYPLVIQHSYWKWSIYQRKLGSKLPSYGGLLLEGWCVRWEHHITMRSERLTGTRVAWKAPAQNLVCFSV